MNRKQRVLWSRERQAAHNGVCVYLHSDWWRGQLGWEFAWLKTAPLPAESVFSQCHYLINALCGSPALKGGERASGGGQARPHLFEGSMNLEKL